MEDLEFRIWNGRKFIYADLEDIYNFGRDPDPSELCTEHLRHDVQEYTGRKDENFKYIYSGDFVEVINYKPCTDKYCCNDSEDETESWIGEVVWSRWHGYVIRRAGHKSEVLYHKKDDELRVIGNVHETPELLNK